MKRIQDLKTGEMYQWTYKNNTCVGHVTTKSPGITRCHYAVGMWEDSEAIEDALPDYLAIDINLREYDIQGFEPASDDQRRRYTRVVKDYQDMVSHISEYYQQEKSSSSPVSCDVSQEPPLATTPVSCDVSQEPPSPVSCDVSQEPSAPSIKIVGKVDLSSLNLSTHPAKKTKEEKRLERELKSKQSNMNQSTETNEERLHRLGEQMKIERNLNNQPEAYYPEGASGHKYADEEVIRFKTNGHEGLAVGMVNQHTGERGYYVAMNILGDNQVVLHGVTLCDGTTAGHWPLSTTTITVPNKMEIQMGQQFLLTTYRSHIDAVKEQNRIDFEAEQERLRKEEEERLAREAEELLAKEEAERKAKAEADLEDEEQEAAMFSNLELKHLPYVRGSETLLDMQWPIIGDGLRTYQAFFGLAEFAKIVEQCAVNQRQSSEGSRTYILTRPYLKELRARKNDYLEQYGYSFIKLLGLGTSRNGTIVYRSGTDHDLLSTIIYNVEIHANGRETVRLALLMNDVLQVTYRGSSQGMFGDASPVISYCSDNSPKNLKLMVEAAKKLLLAFLAMEQDTDRIIHSYVTGEGQAHKVYERSHLANYPDIELRDSTWYTNIFINRTISVDSYKSHRWFGHGDNKHLEEVQVAAYTKSGYTITPKVTK